MEPTDYTIKYGCPQCHSKKGTPAYTEVLNHNYGDYVVLRPDEKSCKRLMQLGSLIKDVFDSEHLGLTTNINNPENMHLTLAMPLCAMNPTQAQSLMRTMMANVNAPLEFNLVLKNANQGGTCGYSFSTMNYAPSFNVQLKRNQQADNSTHDAMTALATMIQTYCGENGLIDSKTGECNKFHPHITLGKINEDGGRVLHNRCEHKNSDQNALIYLVSTKAGKFFREQTGDQMLPLTFDKIEILRCDKKVGQGSKSTVLESYDLNTKKWTEGEFPACMHTAIQAAPTTTTTTTTTTTAPKATVNQGSAYQAAPARAVAARTPTTPTTTTTTTTTTTAPKANAYQASAYRAAPATAVAARTGTTSTTTPTTTTTTTAPKASAHPAMDLIMNRIFALLGKETLWTAYRDKDKNGELISIGFSDKAVADALFAKVAGGKGSVYEKNGCYYVRFGANRMATLFGNYLTGTAMLQYGLKEFS